MKFASAAGISKCGFVWSILESYSQACNPNEAQVCQAPMHLSMPLAQVAVLLQVRFLASEDLMFRVACLCVKVGSRVATHMLFQTAASVCFRPESFSMIVSAGLSERLEERRYYKPRSGPSFSHEVAKGYSYATCFTIGALHGVALTGLFPCGSCPLQQSPTRT